AIGWGASDVRTERAWLPFPFPGRRARVRASATSSEMDGRRSDATSEAAPDLIGRREATAGATAGSRNRRTGKDFEREVLVLGEGPLAPGGRGSRVAPARSVGSVCHRQESSPM